VAGTVHTVDLRELLEKGRGELNIIVESGDVVNVPEAGMVYVAGEVRNPGAFPLKSRMKLLQLVSLAGGLKNTADPSKGRLVRRTGGKETIFRVDLKRIADGRDTDIPLCENDLLQIEEDKVKNVGRGVLGLFGSIFSFGYGL